MLKISVNRHRGEVVNRLSGQKVKENKVNQLRYSASTPSHRSVAAGAVISLRGEKVNGYIGEEMNR